MCGEESTLLPGNMEMTFLVGSYVVGRADVDGRDDVERRRHVRQTEVAAFVRDRILTGLEGTSW